MDCDRRLTCGFCGQGVEAERRCGRLIRQNACAAHLKCMQYSSNLVQYKLSTFGGFLVDEVQTEMKRGKLLKCDVCKKCEDTSVGQLSGATCGCAVDTCEATFHYPCAKESAITARCVDDKTKDVVYHVFCSEKHKEQFNKQNKNDHNTPGEVNGEVTCHAQGERSHSTPRSCYHTCRAKKNCSRRTRSEVYGNNLPDDPTSVPSIPADINANMNAWHAELHRRHKCPDSIPDSGSVRPRKRVRLRPVSTESDSDLMGSSSEDYAGGKLSMSDDSGRDLPCHGRDARMDTSDPVDDEEGGRMAAKRPQKKRNLQHRADICGFHAMDVSWKNDHLGEVFFSTAPHAVGTQDFATVSLRDSGSSYPHTSTTDRRAVLDVIQGTFAAIAGVEPSRVVNVDKQSRIVSLDEQPPQRHDRNSSDEQPPKRNDKTSLDAQPPHRNNKKSLDEQTPKRNSKNSLDEQPSKRNDNTGSDEQPPQRNDKKSLDGQPPQRHYKISLDEQPPQCNEKVSLDEQLSQHYNTKSWDEQPPKRNDKNSFDEQPPKRTDKNSLYEQAPLRYNKGLYNSSLNNRYSVVSANFAGTGGCFLCHHVGGMKKRVEASCQQPRKECVLCFVESDMITLSEQHKREVTAFAQEQYDVVPKHILVWVSKIEDGTPMASRYAIYLIRDISQALRERNYHDVERLVFGLSQQDVDTYERFHQLHEGLGPERQESIHTILHDAIKDDLTATENATDLKIGTLCKVNEQPVFIMYLHVCDVTDPVNRIRSRLCHKQQTTFQWKADTCLANIATYSAKTSEYFHQREARELQFWLERTAEPEISYYEPQIETTTSYQPGSAIFQLKEHFQQHYNSSPHGMSTLVFLGPIDFGAETAATYVKEWIPNVLAEVLTSVRDVYIVLGIDVSHSTCCLNDLTPPLQDNVNLNVCSFANPRHMPVTCVLLHFDMIS